MAGKKRLEKDIEAGPRASGTKLQREIALWWIRDQEEEDSSVQWKAATTLTTFDVSEKNEVKPYENCLEAIESNECIFCLDVGMGK